MNFSNIWESTSIIWASIPRDHQTLMSSLILIYFDPLHYWESSQGLWVLDKWYHWAPPPLPPFYFFDVPENPRECFHFPQMHRWEHTLLHEFLCWHLSAAPLCLHKSKHWILDRFLKVHPVGSDWGIFAKVFLMPSSFFRVLTSENREGKGKAFHLLKITAVPRGSAKLFSQWMRECKS